MSHPPNNNRSRLPPPPSTVPDQDAEGVPPPPPLEPLKKREPRKEPPMGKPGNENSRGNSGPPRSSPPNLKESKERLNAPKSSPPPFPPKGQNEPKETVEPPPLSASSENKIEPVKKENGSKKERRPNNATRVAPNQPNQNQNQPQQTNSKESKNQLNTPKSSPPPFPKKGTETNTSPEFVILPPSKESLNYPPPPPLNESPPRTEHLKKSSADKTLIQYAINPPNVPRSKSPQTNSAQIISEIVDFSSPKARRVFNYDLPEPSNFKSMTDQERKEFIKKRLKHLQEIKDDMNRELQKIESTLKTVNDDLTKVSIRIQEQEKKDKDKKERKAAKEAKGKAKKDKKKKGSPEFKIFGKPLDEIMEREHSTVPRFIKACCEFIRKKSTLQTEGIFRVSVEHLRLEALQREIEEIDQYNFDLLPECQNDPFIVPCLLKKFFREMPEPLIPFDCYTCFISAAGVENDKLREKKYKDVIDMFLPESNKIVLKYLFDFLYTVQEDSEFNKMSYGNLGTCFGPTLLRDNAEYDPMTESLLISTIIANLIESKNFLFGGETSG